MATRIDWKVSATPVVTVAASGEALGADVLSADIKGSLGGGNSSDSWDGGNITGWDAGGCTHLSANGGTIDTPAGCDGVWVKHTGYVYDAAESDNKSATATNSDSYVTITIGSVVVAKLGAGEGMYFPEPASDVTAFITLDDVGTDDAAVEYATFE